MLLVLFIAFCARCDNPIAVSVARKHDAVLQGRVAPASLKIIRDQEAANEVLPYLSGLRNLSSIHISGVDLTEAQLRKIGRKKQIKRLELIDCGIDDDDLSLLAGLRAIVTLDLSLNPITDNGLAKLESMQSLRRLTLQRTRIQGPGLLVVRSLPRLGTLRLSGSPVDDAGVDYLVQAETKVRSLELNCDDFTTEGYLKVANMLWVTHLPMPREITKIEDRMEMRAVKMDLKARFREARLAAIERAKAEGRETPEFVGFP